MRTSTNQFLSDKMFERRYKEETCNKQTMRRNTRMIILIICLLSVVLTVWNSFRYRDIADISSVFQDNEPLIGALKSSYTKRYTYGDVRGIITSEEESFPLAFSILVYKDVHQVRRLLTAIWRPQNAYCIHTDNSSSSEYKHEIIQIAECCNNVFVQPKEVDIVWGQFTVLEPELLCMEELLRRKTRWKYFINLTGQEYPLKTNYELVKILMSYKGANDIGGVFHYRKNFDRWVKAGSSPPHNIQPSWGPVHIAASWEFVNYTIKDPKAKDLLTWVKKTDVPDETYFSTLNHNPVLKVPGSYYDDGKGHKTWSRYKVWQADKGHCNGTFVRGVCNFGLGDIPTMTKSLYLFANKFDIVEHPEAYDAIETWYFDKMKLENSGSRSFNTSLYAKRWIISHHY